MSAADRKWAWIGGVALLAALLVLPFLVKNYRVFQFNLVLVYAIAVLGLNILTGYNGQISLGHGAFYAIGAYAAAILMERAGLPYWATLSITFLVGVVIGGLASIPAAIFGAIFIQFVPNIADQISKSAPWAIYGVFLIGFMYLMPAGVMGMLRKAWWRWRPGAAPTTGQTTPASQ